MKQFLSADRVITGPDVYEDGAVLIEDNRIRVAGPADEIADDSADEVRQFPGYTIMPGLVDGHVHISGPDIETGATEDLVQDSPSEVTVRTIENARRTVEAGVTTVRDLGSPNDTAMTVRDAIRAGTFPGPRILTAGQGLSATGSHGDLVPWHVDGHLDTEAGNIGSKGLVVDGEVGVRRAVRRQVRLGADLIKFWATDGTGDRGGGRTMSYTESEIRAIVDEANRHGLPVAAHAHDSETIEACVEAGVRSIEHGLFMDEEAIGVMAAEGTYLTLTYATMHRLANWEQFGNETTHAALENSRSLLPKARERGVDIAMGTDAGTVTENGENPIELVHMVDAGFTPLEAIRAATIVSSKMLGVDGTVGRLEAGYAADLVAVRGNPLADVSILSDPDRVDFVLRDGNIVKHTGS